MITITMYTDEDVDDGVGYSENENNKSEEINNRRINTTRENVYASIWQNKQKNNIEKKK